MQEGINTDFKKQLEVKEREREIMSRGFEDAPKYIALMREISGEESPESLKLNEDGKIEIKLVEGDKLFAAARKDLGIDNAHIGEMVKYFFALEDAVKSILVRDPVN